MGNLEYSTTLDSDLAEYIKETDGIEGDVE
jgi:hypothetical protein